MARAAWTALLAAALWPRVTAAQTDYRNLDHGSPTSVEDAYPIEHRTLELGLGYGLDRAYSISNNRVDPRLDWGLLPDLQIGLEARFESVSGSGRDGLAGMEGSLLYNLLTESRSLPGLAIGGSMHWPVGRLAGHQSDGQILLAATRSLGRWRAHLNGAIGLTDRSDVLPRWSSGLAIDRTLYRQNLLLIGAIGVEQPVSSALREAVAQLGIRWQATPTLVLNGGLARRVGEIGPDLGLRLGFTRSISLPRSSRVDPDMSPHTEQPGLTQRGAESYPPGSFNWRFLSAYPEAARLFNGFDYGHAILYERLLSGTGDRLEEDFRYLTTDLLVRPPRLGVAEEAIAPHYARTAWRAMQIFDWAHLLHRQIYDVLSDERLGVTAKSEEIERLTDTYLANHRLALAPHPKLMELMDDQFYSQEFRRAYPRFNGLIWSYHWLQVGLYEPLLVDSTVTGRKAGVQAALARFWKMLEAPERTGPTVMPMTPSIAPQFTRQHPRAAAIFDNLHMLHDIVSDILISEQVARDRKATEIYRALDQFQDGGKDLMPVEHWLMMGDMMGGVDRMGGIARPVD